MPITRAAAAHHAVRTKRQSMAGPETFTSNPLPAANGAIPVVSPLQLEMDPATPRTAGIAGDADYYTGRFWALKGRCRRLYGAPATQGAVAFLILGNFVTNIVEKQVWPSSSEHVRDGAYYAARFRAVEHVFNVFFTVELGFNMYAHWCRDFWRSGWNVFDFVTVVICWLLESPVELPPSLGLLRCIRALRVFRLFKRVASLKKILVSLARALPGVVNAFLIMFIVMCIYAILAVDFFRNAGHDGELAFEWCREAGDDGAPGCPDYFTARGYEFGHEYFGNFAKAIFTLFQILTGDSWSEAIGRPLIQAFSPFGAAMFFVSYYLLLAVVLINVVVAVLLEKMVDETDGGEEPDAPPAATPERGPADALERRVANLEAHQAAILAALQRIEARQKKYDAVVFPGRG